MKTIKEKKAWLKKNWLTKGNVELYTELEVGSATLSRWAKEMGLPRKKSGIKREETEKVTPQELIKLDREKKSQVSREKEISKKYDYVLKENERITRELEASLSLKENIAPAVYEYKPLTPDTESVAVVLASDWHIEEVVKAEKVNGLNSFSVKIARLRVEQFFQNSLKLVEKERAGTKIDTLVLALLGDFISGNIHEELLENCELAPIDAMIEAENMILGGIEYLLKNSDLKLIIPCHVGNHTRITKKVHISTETGNSLETIMYHHIKNYFRDNPRVEVVIAQGHLSYLDLGGYTICFSHGHAVKYGGGIGGLAIPLMKAVAQWQKLRTVDLYCIGHWHQFRDFGNAMVNGSLIGFNPFAVFIKADYEKPKQGFFLVNLKHREKNSVSPIRFTI